jgi:hypothetical protein
MIYVGVEVTIGGWAVSRSLAVESCKLISDDVHP